MAPLHESILAAAPKTQTAVDPDEMDEGDADFEHGQGNVWTDESQETQEIPTEPIKSSPPPAKDKKKVRVTK